jgi:hypothetical protein
MNDTQTETKAFKGMKNDLTGHDDFKFSVGQTYEIDPKKEIEPCESGFHACINLIDCFNYYKYDGKNRFFDVTIFGDYKVECDKICGRKIRIDKEVIINAVLNDILIYYNSFHKHDIWGRRIHDNNFNTQIYTNGSRYYYKNGELHHDGDLYATFFNNGVEYYYKNGQIHRDGDLPAVIGSDGTMEYYINGERHRDGDLPALIEPNGYKQFWVKGELRDGDLPAIIEPDGSMYYYKNDNIHRDGDLPAIIRPDGTLEYYKNGEQYWVYLSDDDQN